MKTGHRSPLTAEELGQLTTEDLAHLRLTEDEKNRLREINKRKEQERVERVAEWRRAEEPLVMELREIGWNVESAWDLVNTAEPYYEAIPILIEHIQRDYPERVREGIARALAVSPAVEGWDVLLRLFKAEPDKTTTGVKWALGCALAAAATDHVIDDIIDLIKDRSHGGNRLALIDALVKSRNPRARRTLMELGTDPDLVEEIQNALNRLAR